MTSEPAAMDAARSAELAAQSSRRLRGWLASKIFAGALYGAGLLFIAVMAGLIFSLVWGARLSIDKFGLGFLWSSAWNPVTSQFGALPFIYGTILSSFIALLMASVVGILSGVYLAEFAPRPVALSLSMLIELLAAVPSIVYGLWGLFVLAPVVSSWIAPALQKTFGFLPIFQGTIYGVNMLTAALILALMIVPTIAAISRDLIAMVHRRYHEASLALGATRWETVITVILPFAYRGIFGACILGLGRALGETIATTMVIGNRPAISVSLFAPGYTVASAIANEFTEATTDIYLSSLIELGLVLFVVSVIVIGIGRFMVRFLIRSNEA